MPFCPECEYKYSDEMQLCPDCGTPLVETLENQDEYICDECKEPLTGDAQSCPQCGTVFIETLQCFRHPELPAYGRCVVCAQHLCGDCTVQYMGRCFCEQDALAEAVVEEGTSRTTDAPPEHDWEAEMLMRYLAQGGVSCRLFETHDIRRIVSQGNVTKVKLLASRAQKHLVEPIFEEREIEGKLVLYECERCSAISTKDDTICPNCGE